MQNNAMVDPATALFVFAVLSVLLAVGFWPKWGLFASVRRAISSTERVRMEDALKHLHSVEHRGRHGSIESLAGALEVSRMAAARTVQRLSERELATVDDGTPTLTPEGRDYAVRILRTHRLWERYLADRTAVPPEQWHAAAEEAEHRVTSAEAEALASRLGHPRYDPHGDPIPTAEGELPPPDGVALNTLEPGALVAITHLEDEPPEIFERISAIGLTPHLRLAVLGTDPENVHINVKGEELTLPQIVASNVTVRRLAGGESVHEETATMADLRSGAAARVTGIAAHCQGPQRRRLLDLGVVPGTEVVAEFASAMGDPMAFRIRGALIALRGEQASWVEVENVRTSVEDRDPAEVAV